MNFSIFFLQIIFAKTIYNTRELVQAEENWFKQLTADVEKNSSDQISNTVIFYEVTPDSKQRNSTEKTLIQTELISTEQNQYDSQLTRMLLKILKYVISCLVCGFLKWIFNNIKQKRRSTSTHNAHWLATPIMPSTNNAHCIAQ